MKKVIVISDTHKNQALLRKVFEKIDGISHIFHLGDNYEDFDDNPDLIEGRTLLRVPGLFHESYLNGSLPRIRNTEIEGWKFQLVHFVKDLKSIDCGVDVVFYGHTHRLNFRRLDDVCFVNPGHLKNLSDRGREASYLLLQITSDKLEFIFKNIEHKTIHKEVVYK